MEMMPCILEESWKTGEIQEIELGNWRLMNLH